MAQMIDLSPTPQGYLSIAERLREQIIRHTKDGLAYSSQKQLRALIETAVYLAISHPELYDALMNPLKSKD